MVPLAMIALTMIQMMSGAKQLNNHLVLWIHYYKNQTSLKMVIEL